MTTMNRLHNAKNVHQTDAKRVLCVCSAGLLRSPTVANVLHKEYGYNTRACGTSEEYALIVINPVLLHWADEIVFVDSSNHRAAMANEDLLPWFQGKHIVVLDLPDRFSWNDPELQLHITEQYVNAPRMEV